MEYEPTRGEYSYRFFQALEGGETVTIEFKVGGSVFFANVVQVPHYGKVEDYWKLELSEIRQVAP